MTSRKFYIIDGHGMIHRAYHSPMVANLSCSCPSCKGVGRVEESSRPRIPGQGSSKCDRCNGTGEEPTKATYVFTRLLLKMVREHKPDYLVFAHDGCPKERLHRTKLYPEYKANRPASDWELGVQMRRIKQLVALLGIPLVGSEGYEADDVIATLVDAAKDITGLEIVIVSRDKDLAQLINQGIRMYDPMADEFLDGRWCYKKFGVHPQQVGDWLAMVGDVGDNIKGVPGIGEKGATELLTKHITAERCMESEDTTTKAEKLLVSEAGRKAFFQAERLVSLNADVELDGLESFEQLEFKGLRMKRAQLLFQQLNFQRWG